MAGADTPTERIEPPPPAASSPATTSRAPLYALIGLGAAILIGLIVVIVLIVMPRPGDPLSTTGTAPQPSPTVATLPPVPTATPTPIPSATVAPPTPPTQEEEPEEPKPGFTSLDVSVFDGDGISIKDACTNLLPKAPQNKDHLVMAIDWSTEDIQFVEGTLNGSTPSGWAYLDANGYVFAELDCFTNSGDIWGTNIELRAYDFDGYDVDVLAFRVFGNGDIGDIG